MHTFEALGTRAVVGVADPAASAAALSAVEAEIAACDRACSRFRPDSDLSRLNAGAGRPVPVSERLLDDLAAALRAARLTGGIVDPTVGRALVTLGYDRDFPLLDHLAGGGRGPLPPLAFTPVPGWQAVEIDRVHLRARVPARVTVDLGATAKARCADLAAGAASAAVGGGVLVSLGGDLAFAGPVPDGGWRIRVTDDASGALDAPGQTVALTSGALATSSVSVRYWRYGDTTIHHLIDPRTGGPAPVVWRTVSVTAATCLDANIASTASIILGEAAPAWLATEGLCARLVAADGTVHLVGGWPPDRLPHRPPDRSPDPRPGGPSRPAPTGLVTR
jgi:FAD:protein FMN transferase